MNFRSLTGADYSTLPALRPYQPRKGPPLSFRHYKGPKTDRRIVIILHGSGWHGMGLHPMAQQLTLAGIGHVIVPDLRGHGETPQRRGDVDHIGQFEEDIADLIKHLRSGVGLEGPVILGGHSSGGGLVVRFAGGPFGKSADGLILLAPFLKHDAPTTRPNSGGWATPATRRIIGLTMFNAVGVTVFNRLPVIGFNMPASVLEGPYGHTATTRYSYRLNTGFAPRPDWGADLALAAQPFLLVAGSKDEAFFADRYEAEMSAHSNHGEYRIIPGVDHIGVTTDKAAAEAIVGWLERFK